MSKLKELIEKLPFYSYSDRQPLGGPQAEQLVISHILTDPDCDTGPLRKTDFANSIYAFIFDIWENLKKQGLPRGMEEVADQLRHEDRVGKNGLELVGEAFLIFLKELSWQENPLDTVIQNSVARQLKIAHRSEYATDIAILEKLGFEKVPDKECSNDQAIKTACGLIFY